jgi:PAS domain S-box-containing protein
MKAASEYDKLLIEYRELQLRASKLANVEQQLINTRDRLDHELELYKRLHSFNSKALKDLDDREFSSLIAEVIVDIFEIESAIVFYQSEGVEQERIISIEGPFLENFSNNQIIDAMTMLSAEFDKKQAIIVKNDLIKNVEVLDKFNEGLFFSYIDKELGYSICLGGFVSIENSPLYQKLEERHEAFFGVFVQQIQSLYSNRQKSEKIKAQIRRISISEIELRKLSLIATKTKNGVIITDNEGKIEWVNESFESTTGFTLSEIVGKKPKDFLQRRGVDEDSAKKISLALSKKENIELTIVNFNKDGKQFYNQLEITPVFDDRGELINFIALQKDITEETLVKQELVKANTRFKLVTEKANIGIFDHNCITNQLLWSELLYIIYGIKDNEFEGDLFEFWKNSIHESDREMMMIDLEKVISGEFQMDNKEFKIVRASDQAIRIVRGSIIAEKNENGELIRLLGSSQDITETRLAEIKLKASEEKYRNIIDNMNLGLVEVSKEGEVLFSNKKFEELTFLDSPEALSLYGDYEVALKERVNSKNIKSYRKISDSVFEIDFLRKDSKVVNLLVSAAPVLNQQGVSEAYISIYLDITPLKALQKSLEEALSERDAVLEIVNSMKLFYEGILNHSPAEIKVLDPDLFLTYANKIMLENEPALENNFGNNFKDIGVANIQERVRFDKVIENVEQALKLNSMVQMEELRVDKNGDERCVLKNILPHYDTDGVLDHIVISGVDITDLKRVQEDVLKKNEELKKINSELDNFVYSVSHDLRSPLLSIKGVLSLVLNSEGQSEKNTQFLKLAESSVMRLDGTIQEILEYSRNARLEILPENFNVVEMVNNIFSDLKFTSMDKIDFFLDSKGSSEFFLDKSRINTLLKNLIGNSVKYRRTDIPDPYVRVELAPLNNYYVIIVSDNGEGISPKNINKIFDMYYRGSRSSVGTGLGLYICKEILNKLNGAITVKSEVGIGTIMTITIPKINLNPEDQNEKISAN